MSSPGNDPNLNNSRFNTESSDQYQNPDYFTEGQKRRKKNFFRQVSKEKVIKAYQNFISKMKEKGYDVNIFEDRFLELSINP